MACGGQRGVGVWGVMGGGGCLFHDVSVWPHISRGRSTNQSRPHPIIHWLPQESTAACRTSPLEPSDLLTEARKKNRKAKRKKTTTCNKKAALIVADIAGKKRRKKKNTRNVIALLNCVHGAFDCRVVTWKHEA